VNILQHQKLWLAFKAALFVVMSWFIISRILLQDDFAAQLKFFTAQLRVSNIYFLVAATLLMPLNWLLETIKWRRLLQSTEPLTELLKAVLAGITLGFITPGRSGEFVGRVFFTSEERKAKIFYLSTIGGIAQSVATLVFGVFFVAQWSNDFFINGITIGLATAFALLYFRFDLLNHIISALPFLQQHQLIITNNELPVLSVQLTVLFLSAIRFAVYVMQYALLLFFFGVSAGFYALAVHSGVFLAIQTFSPLMPLLDVSYRGGTALFVFKNLSNNNIAVLTSVLVVWILNLVIPAVLGYLFILKKKNLQHVQR
jgi:hypothetical protein